MPVFFKAKVADGEQVEVRPRFQPTHRLEIVFPATGAPFAGTFLEEVRLEEVATERGAYWAAYTADDWRYGLAPQFEFDRHGRLWVGGEPLGDAVPVSLESL